MKGWLVTFAVMASVFAGCGGDADEAVLSEIPATALTEPTAFSGDDLAELGFFRTGIVLDSGEVLKSVVRPGLTLVQLPEAVSLDFSAGPWTPDSRPTESFGFSARLDHRWYHIQLGLRDSEGNYAFYDEGRRLLSFAYDDGGLHVQNASAAPFQLQVSANSSLDSEPRLVFPWPPRQGAWHRVVVDRRGEIWVESRPRVGVGGVIAVTTGEAINVAALEAIGRVLRGPPYQDSQAGFATYCRAPDQNDGRCFVSGGFLSLALPPLMTATLTCTPNADGRFSTVAVETRRWTLDLIGVQGDECPEFAESYPGGYTIPVTGQALRIWDEEGRLSDLVVTLDGRLYAGNADAELRCPPCFLLNQDWVIIAPAAAADPTLEPAQELPSLIHGSLHSTEAGVLVIEDFAGNLVRVLVTEETQVVRPQGHKIREDHDITRLVPGDDVFVEVTLSVSPLTAARVEASGFKANEVLVEVVAEGYLEGRRNNGIPGSRVTDWDDAIVQVYFSPESADVHGTRLIASYEPGERLLLHGYMADDGSLIALD